MIGAQAIHRLRRQAGRTLLYLTALIVVFVTSFPILWTLFCTFKSKPDLFKLPVEVWPERFTFDNYVVTWQTTPITLYLRNSLLVAVGATIITVLIAALAAYSLSRFPFRGKEKVAQGVLLGYMLPPILLTVPYFVMFNRLGFTNTFWGLMLAHASGSLPFAIWLLWTFFQTIPQDIEDAAKIDGAGRLRVLSSVFLPLAAPGIAASGTLTFISSWNNYLYSSVIASANKVQTLPLAIALMTARDYLRWEVMLAFTGVMIFVVFVLLAGFQRQLLRGFSAAYLK